MISTELEPANKVAETVPVNVPVPVLTVKVMRPLAVAFTGLFVTSTKVAVTVCPNPAPWFAMVLNLILAASPELKVMLGLVIVTPVEAVNVNTPIPISPV
ncbi:hypothetical protein AQBE111736_13765 [Aquirufa beregesia]